MRARFSWLDKVNLGTLFFMGRDSPMGRPARLPAGGLAMGVALAAIMACNVAVATTGPQKEVLQRMVELEDQSRAYREKQHMYARRADELQRQAEDLARGLLGRDAVDPKAPVTAAELQTNLRRLIAPEGPRGKTTGEMRRQGAAKPRVNKESVGEAASSQRMPKVVTSTKGTAGDDHEALVRKAHEVTKGVQKEAAAVVKHVNKVSKTIDKHGGVPPDVDTDRDDDENVPPQFCTGEGDQRIDRIKTIFAYRESMSRSYRKCAELEACAAGRGNLRKCAELRSTAKEACAASKIATKAGEEARKYYTRLNPHCASWRRSLILSNKKFRKIFLWMLNKQAQYAWDYKNLIIPSAEEKGMPDPAKMYNSNPQCCYCHVQNMFRKQQKNMNIMNKVRTMAKKVKKKVRTMAKKVKKKVRTMAKKVKAKMRTTAKKVKKKVRTMAKKVKKKVRTMAKKEVAQRRRSSNKGISKQCICDKECRSDPVDPEYGFMKNGTVIRLRGGCYKKWAVDHPTGVRADWSQARAHDKGWDKFTVVDAGNAPTPEFDKTFEFPCNQQRYVAFRGGRDNKYCAAEGNRWICNRNEIGDWERFEVRQYNDMFVTIRNKHTRKLCDDNRNGITCDKEYPDLIRHPFHSIGCTSWLAQPYYDDDGRGKRRVSPRVSPNYDAACSEESLLGESQHAKFFLDTIKSAAHHVVSKVSNVVLKVSNHVRKAVGGEACKLLKKVLDKIFMGDFMFLKPIILRAVKEFIKMDTTMDITKAMKSIKKVINHVFYGVGKKRTDTTNGLLNDPAGHTAVRERLLYRMVAFSLSRAGNLEARLNEIKKAREEARKARKANADNKLFSIRPAFIDLRASNEAAKCQVMSYFGYMLMYENKVYMAPDGPYKHIDPEQDSQPLQLVIHRYPNNRDDGGKSQNFYNEAKGRPICQMYFEYDFAYCEEWKFGKQCLGALVDKPVRAGLLVYDKNAKNARRECEAAKNGKRGVCRPESWAVPSRPWHVNNDCEAWFTMMQGYLSAIMSVITASGMSGVYTGRVGNADGRMCLYQPDTIADLIENQDRHKHKFQCEGGKDECSKYFESSVQGGKCLLMTGYHNPDSKGYSGRRRAALTKGDKDGKEGRKKPDGTPGNCDGGCCISMPYDWRKDPQDKWKKRLPPFVPDWMTAKECRKKLPTKEECDTRDFKETHCNAT